VGRLRQLERRHRASAARWLHRLRPTHPLEGLAIDTATLADFLHTITGPIVLVGHSYGGEVITNAATGDSQVKALVYDDASLPKQGEDLTDLTTAGSCFAVHDLSTVFTFVPDPVSPSGTVAYVKPTVFPGCFANGLPAHAHRERRLTPAAPGHQHVYRPVRCPGLADHPVLGRRRHSRPHHHPGRAAIHGQPGIRPHHRDQRPHLSMITDPGGCVIQAAQATS
jgi:pimeloyl-ACP methyl ester carboxylesterase